MVMVDQWKMLAVSWEMVVVVEIENLEKCLERWAFARFHPPDLLSWKQSWREELYDLAHAEVSTTAGWDPGTLAHPVAV